MRFSDFTPKERRIIRAAMEWAESELYDTSHMQEDKNILHGLIQENRAVELASRSPKAAQEVAKGYADAGVEKPVGGFDRGGHPIIRYPNGRTERISAGKPEQVRREDRPQPAPGEYAGFLYIECSKCGDIHAFCGKRPISTYRCDKCGGKTPLTDMHHMRIICECGSAYSYTTNVVTQRMDVPCFNCGAPVAVEWIDKLQKYAPIAFHGNRRGKKKGGRR